MEAPFGITFLRKAELYNLSSRFDKQFKERKNKRNNKNPPLWAIEKAILKWTYYGHRHLGSAIKTDHLALGDKDNKLADFGMLDSEGNLKEDFKVLNGKVALQKPLENIVVNGFGEYFDEKNGHNAIIINKEGLLLGEVLAELDSNNFLVKINYPIYGALMNHLGAFILLVITIINLLIFITTFLRDRL